MTSPPDFGGGVPSAQLHVAPSPSSSSLLGLRLTFTQGFLLGQISIIVLALLVVRYILFEDAQTALRKSDEQRRRKAARLLAQRSANGAAAVASSAAGSKKEDKRARKRDESSGIAAITAAILARTGYDLGTHPSETADWLNVVFALALAGYRDDILSGGHATSWIKPKAMHVGPNGQTQTERVEESVKRTAKGWLEEILNASTVGRGMDFLDPIIVNECHFGDEYPFFSNVRIRPADDSGRIRVEVDVDYSDAIVLAIETKLIVNFPKPRFAILPVSLGLTIERFSGTLALELFSTDPSSLVLPTSAPPSSAPRSRHQLHISLHPDFSLEAHASSLLGSKAKLQDIPKIEQLLVGRLRNWVHDRFVWPRFWVLTLPNLGPVPDKKAEQGSSEDKGGRNGAAAAGVGRGDNGGAQQQDGKATMTDEERFIAQQIAARASGALGPDDDFFFDRGLAGAAASGRSFGPGGMMTGAAATPGLARSAAAGMATPGGVGMEPSIDALGRIPGGMPSSVEAWRYDAAALGAPGVAGGVSRPGLAGGAAGGGPGVGSGTSTGLAEAQLRHRASYQGLGRR